MKEIWTLSAAERLKMPGAQQRGVHLAMHPLYDPPLDRWINGFLDRWLAADTRAATRVASAPLKTPEVNLPEFAAAAG
jgi:GMP synthase (glutamine-hydrolysing)